MQPYFFPYIGYFQLIQSVDKFVFYDDVNFIKNGWINRNRILINNTAGYLTVPLRQASSNKLINQIAFVDTRTKLKKTIEQAYKKAPYFDHVMNLVTECLLFRTDLIAELAEHSVVATSKFLGLNTVFERSSILYNSSQGLEKAERLIQICNLNNATTYHNPIGGQLIYDKKDFTASNIELKFLRTQKVEYTQYGKEFIPFLSILDVLMFNSVEKVKQYLNLYELI